MQTLKQKLENKQAVVSIIGLGYVGLPLALLFAENGVTTFGLDVDEFKIKSLKAGKSYIKNIDGRKIKAVTGKMLIPSTDFSNLGKSDCIIICVPTPLDSVQGPDLSYVESTVERIAKYLKKEQLVVLESTTYPGTTDEVVKPILEKTGLKAGRDFYLAFSPEREDPGNKKFNTKNIPKVVGGYNKASTEVASMLYSSAVDTVVPVSSMEVAESTKMLENTFRAINIAFVNDLKVLFDKMGFSVWEVIEASKTKPFGYMPFYPGPGWGGHCIPIDPFYLSWVAKKHNYSAKFIELAGEINTMMPKYVITKIQEALNSKSKALKGSKILILGLAYKNDSDDIRESPSMKLIEKLEAKGAKVDYNDPYVPKTKKTRDHNFNKTSVPMTATSLQKYDCVLIATKHSDYDYDFIFKNAKLIVDTRNAIRRKSSKVIKA